MMFSVYSLMNDIVSKQDYSSLKTLLIEFDNIVFYNISNKMNNIPLNLQQIVESVKQNNLNSKLINQAHKLYNIDLYNIKKFTPQEIIRLYDGILDKNYKNLSQGHQDSWIQNELKIFIWVLVAYGFLEKKHIKEFTQQDWLFFPPIFNNRDTEFFKFQGNFILKSAKNCRNWQLQEMNMLKIIITQRGVDNKWNYIARQLFSRSKQQFFRTPKQCRQKWFNHLDPSKKHSKWSSQEDYNLFKFVTEEGKRWSTISKRFNGTRTEHMVKNRYKALINSHMKTQKRLKQQEIVKKILLLQKPKYSGADIKIPNLQIKQKSQTNKLKRKPRDQDYKPKSIVRKLEQTIHIVKPTFQNASQSSFFEQESNSFENKACLQNFKLEEQFLEIDAIKKPFQTTRIQVGEENNLPSFFTQMESEEHVIPFVGSQNVESFISECIKTPMLSSFYPEESSAQNAFEY